MSSMGFEITTTVTVGPNGHIEADLPELITGQTVELVVRSSLKFVKGFGGMRDAGCNRRDSSRLRRAA